MDNDAIRKKVISGFAWEGITKLISQCLSWASTVIVARLLVPEDYGIVAISGVFTGILAVISEMGLTAGLIYQKKITQQQMDAVFWLGIILALILYGAIYFSADYIEQIYAVHNLSTVLRLSGLVFFLSSLKVVPIAITLRELNFPYRSSVEMLGQIVNAATAIFLAYLGYGFWSLIWSVLASQLFVTIAYVHKLPRLPRLPHLRTAIPIITFGTKMMTSSILDFVTTRSGTFIIGTFIGEKNTGYYSLANTIAQIPLEKIGSIFNRITFPATSRLNHDAESAKNLFISTHKTLLALAYPFLVGSIIASQDLVTFVFGAQWAPAAPILQVICGLNLFRISGMLLPPTLEGMGSINAVVRYHVLSAICVPICMLIGAHWGAIGVVRGLACIYPILYLILLSKLLEILHISPKTFFNSCRPTFFSCIGLALAATVTQSRLDEVAVVSRLLMTVVAGFLGYALVYSTFFNSELKSIYSLFRKLRKN